MSYIAVPGTPYITILEDNTITRFVLASGRLDWDAKVRTLPEVMALGPGQVVLDIGAFIGDTTKIFTDRGCEVHAFECLPDAFRCLKHNCPLARLYPQPVGDGEVVKLSTMKTGNLGSRIVSASDKGEKTLRIDDLNLPWVDLVKIDVEGYEPKALDGMAVTLELYRPVVLIEINEYQLAKHGFTAADIFSRLKGWDFREYDRYDAKQYDVVATPK